MGVTYEPSALSREDVDGFHDVLLLDFGTNWCGHCQLAMPLTDEGLSQHPEIRHLRVEDGAGRKLGRSFRVKLWPTLILIERGVERARLVRPSTLNEVMSLLRGGGV